LQGFGECRFDLAHRAANGQAQFRIGPSFDQAGAEHERSQFIDGERERRQLEALLQPVTHTGFTLDWDPALISR
jgi:hypothetical protein